MLFYKNKAVGYSVQICLTSVYAGMILKKGRLENSLSKTLVQWAIIDLMKLS